jgi:hypothetical protein
MVALLCPAACGSKKKAAPAPPVLAPVAGLSAIPAEARVVVGVNVTKVAASPLVRRVLSSALDRDPVVRKDVSQLILQCHLDPARDLDSVLVALGDPLAPTEALLVAQGKLDPSALVACIKESLAEDGQTVTETQVDGQTAYVMSGGAPVWFMFTAPGTVVAAASEAWLRKARDPAAPKCQSNARTAGLLARTDTTAAMWGVGFLPAELGSALMRVTDQAVKQPATALFGQVRVDKELAVELHAELHDEADARALAEFGGAQLGHLTLMAQAISMGSLVSKIKLEAHGKIARVSVTLDPADLDKLEAGLAALTNDMEKEGAPK